MNNDGGLLIPSANIKDSGNYECRVTHDGIYQESIDVQIIEKPLIISKPATISSKPGDNVTFDCNIEVCALFIKYILLSFKNMGIPYIAHINYIYYKL